MSSYVIVVATDFTETSELALASARSMAVRMTQGELHVLHVMAPFVGPSTLEPFVLAGGGPVLGQALADAQGRLADCCIVEAGGPTVTPHVRVGAAAEQIVDFAREVAADLVVVGTHGRRGVARLALGSVAEQVVRAAPCMVLVARPKQETNAPAIEPPCDECVAARSASAGAAMWCDRHGKHHPHAHTYFERSSGSSFTGPSFRFGGGG